MDHDLSKWVHKFAGVKVLLVGDLILDRYLYGDAERISPEAPVPVLRTVERVEAVGGTANVAACLRALGCEVVCVGVIGCDSHGERLTALLEESGIDTTGVLPIKGRPTTTKTRLIGLAQHRHRQQLLRVDEEDVSPLRKEAAAKLAATASELIAECDIVCIEDYDKGVVTDELVRVIEAVARKRDRRVLVDPARLKSYDRYRGAGVVTPNREELSIVAGRALNTIEEVASAAGDLLDAQGIQAVVATVDREGSVVVERGKGWQHLPTVPRSVYDNTGAGDAVLAMLAASLAAGADLASAARLANVAGGLEVEKFGCVPISSEEILAELRLEGRSGNGKLRFADDLVAELVLRRDRGETIAFTNGCYDILHAGHVDFLQRSRREASLLVVGLNSDDSVRSLGKGDDRPINRFEHRAAVLGAMECVDYVVRFDESTPEALIRKVRPDVLIKGEDWGDKGVVGREFVEANGGRVLLLPLMEGLSTSSLVERIRMGV